MSHPNKELESTIHSESGNAIVVVLLVLVVGALGFVAGRMLPAGEGLAIGNMQKSSTKVSSASDEKSYEVSEENPVVAKVNGKAITLAEVEDSIKDMPPQFQQFPPEALFQIALDQMIGKQIVDSKMEAANLEGDEEVKREVANAKDQIMRAIFIEREVEKAMTDDRIQEAYNTYKESFPETEEVRAAHILVEEEAKAKELLKKLKGGADFAELAKENSIDGTADNGGDIGYFSKEQVVPAFAEAAFGTQPGSYTKEPVKSDFGYHIIKVEDKRVRPPASFEEAKPFLEQEISRKLYSEVVARWREDADIERFDQDGNPISQQAGIPSLNVQDAVEPATGEAAPEEGEDAAASEEAPEEDVAE